MTPILLTPPLNEPVTLDEAKEWLKIDTDDEDELLQTLISAARLMIEAASCRILIDQTWRIVLNAWPVYGRLRLPVGPLRQVAAIRIYDSNGVAQALAGSLLLPEAGAEPPVLMANGPLPSPGRALQGIEVDVLIGHGPQPEHVPAPLRQAVLRLVTNWFENRGDVMGGEATALPREIMALVAPYRRVRL